MPKTDQQTQNADPKNLAPDSEKVVERSENASVPSSALELLKADHRKVEGLFASYERAGRRQEKSKIARDICRELINHAAIEEEIFYPACRAFVEDAKLDEALVEHDGVKILISEIAAGSPSDAFFDAKVKVLSEYIRHHVQEEEKRVDSIFAQAEKGGLDVADIGQQMQARKEELQKEIEKEFTLPQLATLDVKLGEDANKEDEMASRDYGRGRDDDDDDRRGRRMPERDEYGRFMSDEEDDRRGGRGGRSMPERDEYGRFMSDDDYGSSRGERYSSRSREDEDSRYARREGSSQSRYRGSEDSDRYSGRGGYSNDRGQGGWFGDREGHAEAARRGWEEREGYSRSSRGRDYDDADGRSSRSQGTSQSRSYDRYEDDRRSGNRGGRSDDRGQGGWFGDPEGHSEASRRGWENRR